MLYQQCVTNETSKVDNDLTHTHAGPAPVATYFRPRPPLTKNEQGNSNGRSNGGNNTDVGDDTAAATATATAALTEATNTNGPDDGEAAGTTTGGGGEGRRPAAGENQKPAAAGEQEGAIGCGDQDWELFDDDNGEHTARFRGRKLV